MRARLVLAIGALALGGAAQAQGVTPQAFALGVPVQKALGASSPKNEDGQAYGCFALQPPAGTNVEVSLTAKFAGKIVVGRGALCPVSSPLALSRATGTGASVRFTAGGGRYIVMAIGPASGGAYTLRAVQRAQQMALAETSPPPVAVAEPEPAPAPTPAPRPSNARPPSSRKLMMEQQVAAREAELARIAEERRIAEEQRKLAEEQARLAAEEARIIREAQEEERRIAEANRPDTTALVLGAMVGAMQDFAAQQQAEYAAQQRMQAQLDAARRQAAARQAELRAQAEASRQAREAALAQQRAQQASSEQARRTALAQQAQAQAAAQQARQAQVQAQRAQAAQQQRAQQQANAQIARSFVPPVPSAQASSGPSTFSVAPPAQTAPRSAPTPPKPVVRPVTLTFPSRSGWVKGMSSNESCVGDLCVRITTPQQFGFPDKIDTTAQFRTTTGRRWCGSMRLTPNPPTTTFNTIVVNGRNSYNEPMDSGVMTIYLMLHESTCTKL